MATGLTYVLYPWFVQLVLWSEQFMSQRMLFVAFTTIIHAVLYFGVNSMYLLLDKYAWLARYKIPRKSYQVPSEELVHKTLREAILSQFFFQPFLGYALYPLFQVCGFPASMTALLPRPSVLFRICTSFRSYDCQLFSYVGRCFVIRCSSVGVGMHLFCKQIEC